MERVRVGNVTITRGDAFEDFARRATQLPEIALRVLGQSASEAVERAQQRWPEDTGRSRDGLFWGVHQTAPDLVASVISGDAPYTRWVPYEGFRAFERLVIEPGLHEIDQLGGALGAAMSEGLEG